MQKFQCLPFELKRSYICHSIICMTVPLNILILQGLTIYELSEISFNTQFVGCTFSNKTGDKNRSDKRGIFQ